MLPSSWRRSLSTSSSSKESPVYRVKKRWHSSSSSCSGGCCESSTVYAPNVHNATYNVAYAYRLVVYRPVTELLSMVYWPTVS